MNIDKRQAFFLQQEESLQFISLQTIHAAKLSVKIEAVSSARLRALFHVRLNFLPMECGA